MHQDITSGKRFNCLKYIVLGSSMQVKFTYEIFGQINDKLTIYTLISSFKSGL